MTVELFHGFSWNAIPKLLTGEWVSDLAIPAEVDDSDMVTELLKPKSVNMVLTDPPYGVNFQSTYGKDEEDREKYQAKIDDDEDIETAIWNFRQTLSAMLPALADECELYVFSQWQVCPEWQKYLGTLTEYGIELYQLLIWEKGYPGIGDVKYNWGCGHEFIYYLKRGRRRVPYRRSGILHFDKVRPGTNIHPTEKPVDLLKVLIEYSTVPGQLILDPYAGSGSALSAAREMGRHAVGIEMKLQYVQDARKRLSQGGLFDL